MRYNYRSYTFVRSNSENAKQPQRRENSRLHKRWLVLAFILLAAGVHIDLSHRAEARAIAAAQASEQRARQADFAKLVKSTISDNPQLSMSVSIVPEGNNQPQSFGQKGAQDAASTAKLITAAAYLHKVELGQVSLNHLINGELALAQLKILINQSDDTAWATFNDELGHNYLQAYADNLGLTSYSPDENLISSSDMARLVSRLYGGKLLNPTHTKLLLSYMQHTNYEDFITPAVISGARLYHKVGIDDDQVNDVGVIAEGNDSFTISIFTNGNGTYDWPARALLIQKVTEAAEKAYL